MHQSPAKSEKSGKGQAKVKSVEKWRGKTYAALVALSESDKELRSYLSWIRSTFSDHYDGGHPKTQAIDLAGYLSYVNFSKPNGFERQIAK